MLRITASMTMNFTGTITHRGSALVSIEIRYFIGYLSQAKRSRTR